MCGGKVSWVSEDSLTYIGVFSMESDVEGWLPVVCLCDGVGLAYVCSRGQASVR